MATKDLYDAGMHLCLVLPVDPRYYKMDLPGDPVEVITQWLQNDGHKLFKPGKVPTEASALDQEQDTLFDGDPDKVAQAAPNRLKALMQLGIENWKPVLYAKYGKRLFLLDGNHRRYLAWRMGVKLLDARVIDIKQAVDELQKLYPIR